MTLFLLEKHVKLPGSWLKRKEEKDSLAAGLAAVGERHGEHVCARQIQGMRDILIAGRPAGRAVDI
jgi:hypothetical protein